MVCLYGKHKEDLVIFLERTDITSTSFFINTLPETSYFEWPLIMA